MTKGRAGESRARTYLEDRGHRWLRSNFRTRRGEIDLITQEGPTFVFVEVKTWDFATDDCLEASITPVKRQRIMDTALAFLAEIQADSDSLVRFDVIFITKNGEQLRHYPGAFTEAGFS